jgi:hypothetical protein
MSEERPTSRMRDARRVINQPAALLTTAGCPNDDLTRGSTRQDMGALSLLARHHFNEYMQAHMHYNMDNKQIQYGRSPTTNLLGIK